MFFSTFLSSERIETLLMEGYFNFSTLMLNEGDPNREALVLSAVQDRPRSSKEDLKEHQKEEDVPQARAGFQSEGIPTKKLEEHIEVQQWEQRLAATKK